MPRLLFACMLLVATAVGCAPADGEESAAGTSSAFGAKLRYTPKFVLEKVLAEKKREFDPTKPIPEVRFASEASLAEFQAAVAQQWTGTPPTEITNVFVVSKNVIYLLDDPEYYKRHSRCIDDSLAHELTHYVQSRYQGWVLNGEDDSIELDAIDIQTTFRKAHCATP